MRTHGIVKVRSMTAALVVNSGAFLSAERLAAGQYRVTLKEAIDPDQCIVTGSMDHDMLASTAGIGITHSTDTQIMVTMGGAAAVDADFSLEIKALF